jgi:hypothetical protein
MFLGALESWRITAFWTMFHLENVASIRLTIQLRVSEQ